jgi:hypothetical protein
MLGGMRPRYSEGTPESNNAYTREGNFRMSTGNTKSDKTKSKKHVSKSRNPSRDTGSLKNILESATSKTPSKISLSSHYDDGSNSMENTNRIRRLVASLRAELSRLTVTYNDLKFKSSKEIRQLRN